jgi:hypothetical protein
MHDDHRDHRENCQEGPHGKWDLTTDGHG